VQVLIREPHRQPLVRFSDPPVFQRNGRVSNLGAAGRVDQPPGSLGVTIAKRPGEDEDLGGDVGLEFGAGPCRQLRRSRLLPEDEDPQLGGHKATARAKDPSVRFDLNTREGDANIKSIAVTLPNALEIDQNHLGNLCGKSELETTHCAGRQPIGTVKDETPLLEAPLEGNAYAVSGYGGLPHVAFILGGQVMVVPQGESTQTPHGLRTEVPTVPDVPIGHFALTLFGGKRGYLANTRDLCQGAARTKVAYVAQNGKELTQKVPIKTACAAKAKRAKRHHH
jgi:hypothetical protein